MDTSKFVEVMVDIETTGLKPGCAIWQVGAVSSIREYFNCTINPNGISTLGLVFEPDTIMWQATTNRDNWDMARTMQSNSSDMKDMLQAFSNWLNRIRTQAEASGKTMRLWCKGTDFDFPILEKAFEIFGIRVEWKYRELNDLRTLCNVFNSPVPKFAGAHDAFVDAREQHKHLLTLLEKLPNVIQNNVPSTDARLAQGDS